MIHAGAAAGKNIKNAIILTNQIVDMQSTQSLNIVLLPDASTQKVAIELSRKLAGQYPTEFELNQTNILPHVTIYQADFPESNLEKIKSAIDKISSHTKKFDITLSTFSFLSNFIFWNVVISDEIKSLHEKIVEELNPLRNGIVKKELLEVKDFYPGDQSDIRKYGSLLIGPNYLPHLTITCFKKTSNEKQILDLFNGQEKISFTIDKLHLGILGQFGTVNKIIHSWKLLDTF